MPVMRLNETMLFDLPPEVLTTTQVVATVANEFDSVIRSPVNAAMIGSGMTEGGLLEGMSQVLFRFYYRSLREWVGSD